MPQNPFTTATVIASLLGCIFFNGLPSSAAATKSSHRDAIIESARKYLIHGLVEHKPELVPLAKNCWRLEQGRNTGSSGTEIKQRLLRQEYKVITGISDERWLVEGNETAVFYDLHISSAADPVLIAERFKVVGGLIEEIEAFIVQPKTGIEDPTRPSDG